MPDRNKVVWHRELLPDAKLGKAMVTRQQGKWYVALSVEATFAETCGTDTVGVALGLKRGMLARSVHDAAWSILVQYVRYKAETACAEVVLVDPRGTSETCPDCGTIQVKTLSERRHRCGCGADLDRDVAAAIVVHRRAFEPGPGHGFRCTSQRVAT